MRTKPGTCHSLLIWYVIITTKPRESARKIVKRRFKGPAYSVLMMGYKFSLLSLQARSLLQNDRYRLRPKLFQVSFSHHASLTRPTLRVLTGSSTLQCTRIEHDRITMHKGNRISKHTFVQLARNNSALPTHQNPDTQGFDFPW